MTLRFLYGSCCDRYETVVVEPLARPFEERYSRVYIESVER